ncbi:MAG: (d)CMP kinase [bacterium]
MNETLVIAIDGPSASGKSTVARGVAMALGYVHVDSGALYRGITWNAITAGIDAADRQRLVTHINGCNLQFKVVENTVRFTINGTDPWPFLRSDSVRANVSTVAAVPEVRERVVQWLRRMTLFGNLVMEGRDIGSVVFANSRFKFYLDADPAERARRRCSELAASENTSLEAVRKALESRDRKDSARDAAPLKIAEGATVIDTTPMTIDQVVAFIVDHVRTNNPA